MLLALRKVVVLVERKANQMVAQMVDGKVENLVEYLAVWRAAKMVKLEKRMVVVTAA